MSPVPFHPGMAEQSLMDLTKQPYIQLVAPAQQSAGKFLKLAADFVPSRKKMIQNREQVVPQQLHVAFGELLCPLSVVEKLFKILFKRKSPGLLPCGKC